MMKTPDAIVVGAGVIGAACAYYMTQAGLDVRVIDRADASSGTTRASDGDVLAVGQAPGYKSRMARISQELLHELVDQLDGDLDYKRTGSGLVVENEQEAEFARGWARQLGESGLPVRYLDRSAALDAEPLLAGDVVGMVECDSDSSLNPMELTYSLLRAAQRTGRGEIQLGTSAARILLTSSTGGVRGIATDTGESIMAKIVVVACGVWTPALMATAGIRVPIEPRRGHLMVSQRTQQTVRRKLMEFGYLAAKFEGLPPRAVSGEMVRYGIAMVIEPTGHGNVLIGSSREFAGFDTTAYPRVPELMARRALRFFPSLRDMQIIRSYAGLRPATSDSVPIVSAVDSIPGLFVAAGHEGSGVALAPVTGKLVSELTTGAPTTIDTTPLSLHRFTVVPPHTTKESA